MIAIIGHKDKCANYENACKRSGLEYIVTSTLDEVLNDDYIDGLLITGGGDVNPKRYGEENNGLSGEIDDEWDEIEFKIIDIAVKKGLPIMGICRGMQLLNVYFGGTLIQHMPTADDNHRFAADTGLDEDRYHETIILPGTYLHQIYGDKLITNSYHHQCIGKVAADFEVIERCALDDVPEAFKHKALPIIGFQWHPERAKDSKTHVSTKPIFDYFKSLL